MGEYDGPSFLKHVKNQSSHTSTNRLKANLEKQNLLKEEAKDQDLFKEESRYSLPNQIISRVEVEKGFQEYLEEKKVTDIQGRTKHYINPPFEVSKVASPIYGFKKPVKKVMETWDYELLKGRLQKEPYDFILFEAYVTEEMDEYWEKKSRENKAKENHEDEVQSQKRKPVKSSKVESKQDHRKRMRLQRSLMNIIQEEQLGTDESKRNIPGFFSD